MRSKRLCRVTVVAALLALGACATPSRVETSGDAPPRAARPNVNLSGYNAAFKEGYADGCESARQAMRRNAQRYGTDTDYTMGWNDGLSMCKQR